jgi:hypothetical protein
MLSMGTGRPSLSSGASASSAAHLQEHPTYSNERTLQEHTPPSTISAAVPPVPALSLGPDARHLVDRAVPLPNPSSSAAAELSSPVRPLPRTLPPSLCTSVLCHLHLARFLPSVLASGSPSRELVHR